MVITVSSVKFHRRTSSITLLQTPIYSTSTQGLNKTYGTFIQLHLSVPGYHYPLPPRPLPIV